MSLWIVLQTTVIHGAYPYDSTKMVAYKTKDEATEGAIAWMHREPEGTYSIHECELGLDVGKEDAP